MKLGVVILSRFNSSRLPGKALLKIQNKAILEYIIERIIQVVPKADIVIATSEQPSDDAIAEFSKLNGINCFRGSLDNVADRFYQAASTLGWDYAVRINGDNIFVDTQVLADMVLIAKSGKYHFISNVKDRTFPKGMSVEIVRLKHYASLLKYINESDRYREHVTLYLYENEVDGYFFHYNVRVPEASGLQMALDTPDDMLRTEKIIRNFKHDHWNYNLKEIYSIWKSIENEPI
jgi:spore coat polysaccharide biosynthesis protein SpsF